MALEMEKETDIGLFLNAAYLKIDLVSGNKEFQTITLCTYVNDAACLDNKSPVEQKYYTFNPSVEEGAQNFIKQGYEYLKSLPEFTSAIDV